MIPLSGLLPGYYLVGSGDTGVAGSLLVLAALYTAVIGNRPFFIATWFSMQVPLQWQYAVHQGVIQLVVKLLQIPSQPKPSHLQQLWPRPSTGFSSPQRHFLQQGAWP